MGKLDGKVAIVTGASRGIGQAIAELFAAEGARVVCAARTLNEGDHAMLEGSLARTVERIRANGGTGTAVAADVSTEPECQRLMEQARAAYGPIDILVNNAALSYTNRPGVRLLGGFPTQWQSDSILPAHDSQAGEVRWASRSPSPIWIIR
ncbi:MAG TPA: SDR family NAD(P)-dependent oxidoreductase, partial [Acetobacteraceae bacterium]|nr:SDR family NAD(P)-dependent oxidoreductase [Acetobacteraceae bacterium]